MSNKKEESKKRILEAAKECFALNGYNNTSVRQICEAADANLALVSYYYGSKENLFYAVIQRLSEDVSHLFGNEPIHNPVEALDHYIHQFLHTRNEDKLFHMILRHELSSDGVLKEAISPILTPCFEYLRRILAAGREQQLFHFASLARVEMFVTCILVYPAYDSLLTAAWSSAESDSDLDISQTVRFILMGLGYSPVG